MAIIRRCRNDERDAIYTIVNSAEAYRDVIPADRRHEPHMPRGGTRRQDRGRAWTSGDTTTKAPRSSS
jgi:hypothetical protein